jgi:hypothetical protein
MGIILPTLKTRITAWIDEDVAKEIHVFHDERVAAAIEAQLDQPGFSSTIILLLCEGLKSANGYVTRQRQPLPHQPKAHLYRSRLAPGPHPPIRSPTSTVTKR